MEVYEFPMCCAATVFANFGSTLVVHNPDENKELVFEKNEIRHWLSKHLAPYAMAGNGEHYIKKDAFVCITLNDEQRSKFGDVIEEFGFKEVARGTNAKYLHNHVTLFVKIINSAPPFVKAGSANDQITY